MADDDQADIRAVFTALASAIEHADFEAAAACFADDAVLMLPGLPVLAGRSAIRAALARGFGAGAPKTEVTVMAVDVAASRDLGCARGVGITHVSPPQRSKWLAVLRRHDGRWRIAADIFNDDGTPEVA